MPAEPFQRLALALAIGFLVGVERGWRDREIAEGGRTAGIRTFALIGLLGGVAGLLSPALGGWAFAVIGLPLASAFVIFKQREQEADGDYSVTGIVAALLVFALGAYSVVGEWRLAAAAAVVATGLLAFKRVLHGWLARLTWPELRSALVLLAMSFVALPLLPNRGFGPFQSINPYELWLLTILLAGVSFVAYAAVKIFGPSRGVVVASLAGALVSSTAVTLNLARLARRSSGPPTLQAGAAILAGMVMALRIGAIAVVLSPQLLERLLPPLAGFALASGVIGFAMTWRHGSPAEPSPPPPVKSPFDLSPVFKFALVLGAILAAARIVTGLYGSGGVLPMAAAAGLADVDAVTVAVARMTAAEGLDARLAAHAILLAGAVDSASKAALAAMVGGPRFGAAFTAGTLVAAGAAWAGLHWTA